MLVQEIFVLPWLLNIVSPVQTIFFLTRTHYFHSFNPIARQAGQAAVLGHLSLSMCLSGVHCTQYLADHPSRDAARAHADRSGSLQTLLHPGKKVFCKKMEEALANSK